MSPEQKSVTTSQSDLAKEFPLVPTIERAIFALKNLNSTTNVLARLKNGVGGNELDALVLLKDCLESGYTEKIGIAMDKDVRFVGKWFHIKGKDRVLRKLAELSAAYQSAKTKSKGSTFISNANDEDLMGQTFKPLMIFVDGTFRGFSLAVLSPGKPGVTGSYGVSFETNEPVNPKAKNESISGIYFNHFERLNSGWAMFSSLSCVPSPQALRQSTQFEVRVRYALNNETLFSVLTHTDKFECILEAEDVDRLVRWTNAVACNVDRCTVFFWQRCQVELTARALGHGWVRLMICSARDNERYDLNAVVSVHEMVTKFKAGFEKLAAISTRGSACGGSVGVEDDQRNHWDQLEWPNIAAEGDWKSDEPNLENISHGK